MTNPLLNIDGLTVKYQTNEGMLTAVSDASFNIEDGSYVGIIGESGCGKSTIAKAILGILENNGVVSSGELKYRGIPLQNLSEKELNERIRWTEISYIPQSSMNNLDPLQKISDQAIEVARTHTDLGREEALNKFRTMFEIVGLPPSRVSDYPHQFSGGMKQRAIIALALFLEPSLIIADEPTTALDVIMQDQIFSHIAKIKDRLDTSMILITHDISLVFETCERIVIMHNGQVAEAGPVQDIYNNPRHPYSILLQEAFPDIRYPTRELGKIDGTPSEVIGELTKCSFVDRCPWAIEECKQSVPPLEPIGGRKNHTASCFRKSEVHEIYEQESYQRSDDTAPNTSEGTRS